MTTATAIQTTQPRATQQAPASPTTTAAPTRTQGFDRQTKLLAAVTGAGTLIVLVFFLAMIAMLGANGRTQRAYSSDHPVAPVTRLAR